MNDYHLVPETKPQGAGAGFPPRDNNVSSLIFEIEALTDKIHGSIHSLEQRLLDVIVDSFSVQPTPDRPPNPAFPASCPMAERLTDLRNRFEAMLAHSQWLHDSIRL